MQTSSRSSVSVEAEVPQEHGGNYNRRAALSQVLWSLVNLLERIAAALCILALLPVFFVVASLVTFLSGRRRLWLIVELAETDVSFGF